MKKSEILQIITEEISTVLIPESADQSHRLTEALARGLKPLLTVGAKITSKVGEDALVKLSDKFDRIDDEDADNIASHLNMAIELMQDGYPGDATKKLKQFNKACKDLLKGKSIKSAFEGKVNEAKLRKGDIIKMQDGEYGVVNKLKGKVAYIKLDSMPGSFHPIEADRTTYKGKHKGKDLYLESLNESMIGIHTKANFKPNTLRGELERAGIKGFKMDRLTWSLSMLKLDSKDLEKAKKIIDTLPKAKIKMVKEGNLTEASRKKVFKAVKKGSYPVTLVAIDNGKVVHQELARTPEIVPAAFNVLQTIIKKKHPNAKIRVEDNTGKLLFVESKLNEEEYKYKKYASKSFKEINDAMFDFRHSMGIKTLTNKDMKLKKKVDSLHQAIFSLQKEMKKDGLTEAKLNEMDMNDPILVAIRARKTMLAKEKSAPKTKKISMAQYYKLMDTEIDLINDIKNAYKEYERLDSEMNQEAGQKGKDWTDADANRYGADLNKLQTKIEKLAKLKLAVKKQIMNYRVN